MSDVAIAIGLAAFLVFVFLLLWLGARLRWGTAAMPGDAKLQGIEDRLGAVEHDLRNVRMTVENLPSKDATHRLEVEMTALAGKVGKVEAELTSASRAVDRIEDILLRSLKT